MVFYAGRRTVKGCEVIRHAAGSSIPLPPRLDAWSHSSTGFEWGYEGSGPAQLALALLSDALGDEERAMALHLPFKGDVIARLPAGEWRLAAEEITAYARQIEAHQRLPVLPRSDDEAL